MGERGEVGGGGILGGGGMGGAVRPRKRRAMQRFNGCQKQLFLTVADAFVGAAKRNMIALPAEV